MNSDLHIKLFEIVIQNAIFMMKVTSQSILYNLSTICINVQVEFF